MNHNEQRNTLLLVKQYESSPNEYMEADEYDLICDHYLRMAQFTKAVAAIQKGIELHPTYTPLYYQQARCYMEQEKWELSKQSIQYAIAQYKKRIVSAKKKLSAVFWDNMYESLLLKAEISLRCHEPEEAKKMLQAAVHYAPYIPYPTSPYLDFAHLYLQEDMLSEANACLQKACKADPKDQVAWAMLCQTYFQLGQSMQGIKVLEEMTKMNPYSNEAWCRLGIAYREMGMVVEAENAFEYSISIDEKHTETWYNYALLHLENTNYQRAIDCLKVCNELTPNQLVILLNWIICERQLGLYQEALQRCHETEKSFPNEKLLLVEKGITLFMMQAWEDALRVFLPLADGEFAAQVVSYVSKIYYQLDNIPLAIAYAQKSVKADSNSSRWAWLGTLYLTTGDYDMALQTFLHVAQINPNHPLIDLHISLAYQALNNLEQAKNHFSMAYQKDKEAVIRFLESNPDISHVIRTDSIADNHSNTDNTL